METVVEETRLCIFLQDVFWITEVYDFPDGTEDKNSPADAGDSGSITGPVRFHMPQGN